MSGRYFSIPLLCSVIALCEVDFKFGQKIRISIYVSIVIIGLMAPFPTIFRTSSFAKGIKYKEYAIDSRKIADEQVFYFQSTGLLVAGRFPPLPYKLEYFNRDLAQDGRNLKNLGRAVTTGLAIGITGFFAGPGIYIIDIYALTDPLLARQPAVLSGNWRIGHFRREIPDGYIDSISTGKNIIKDTIIANRYDQIKLITRVNLFDSRRLRAIIKEIFRI